MKKASLRITLRIVFWLFTAIIMGVIFAFSAQSGSASQEVSSGFIGKLLSAFYPDFESLEPDELVELTRNLQVVIRKTAHLTVYAGLGCFVSLALLTHYMKISTRLWTAELICAVYAATDELHQMFVPFRGPMLTDVLIDAAGAALGIVFTQLFVGMIFKKHILSAKPVLTDSGN